MVVTQKRKEMKSRSGRCHCGRVRERKRIEGNERGNNFI